MKFEDMKIKDIKLAIRYCPDLSRWVAKNRSTHIIGINLSGKELHDFGYQKIMIEGTGIFFFNCRDDYAVEVLEKGLSYSIHFTTYEPVETDTFFIKTANVTEFYRILERIEKQLALSNGGGHLSYSDFYRLCAGFEEIRQKDYSPTDGRMLQAEEYIKLHFREIDCLRALYQSADISRRHFDTLFKKQFDMTPSRYILLQKIEYSKQLLQTPNLSIMEVAELCGFSDVYYFSKVFKAQTNLSPAAFRKGGHL